VFHEIIGNIHMLRNSFKGNKRIQKDGVGWLTYQETLFQLQQIHQGEGFLYPLRPPPVDLFLYYTT
jgi:hypothetical protein